MADYRIALGMPPDRAAQTAALYDEAFRQKLRPLIPDDTKRQAVLADCLVPARAFVALADGDVVGLAGFHHAGQSFTGAGGWRTLFSHLGLWGSIRAGVGFALFERSPEPGELLMDGIAVDSAWRGRGIGSALLAALFEHARETGAASIRLDVIDTNPDARRLYTRKGFEPTETVDVAWMKGIFGFGAATTMVKRL